MDLAIALDDEAGPPVVGRVGAADCPDSLMPGERVSVRLTMGVMVRVARGRLGRRGGSANDDEARDRWRGKTADGHPSRWLHHM